MLSLEDVVADRQLGASEIEERLLERLCEAPPPAANLLGELTTAVVTHHPEMANLVGLVNQLWQAHAAGVELATAARAWREAALARRPLAAQAGAAFLHERGVTVALTLSQSSAVMDLLQAAAGAMRGILGESRPLREGVTAARRLAAAGVPVTVVSDALLLGLPLDPTRPAPLGFAPRDAAVVVGADALTACGFVNKSGTLALAATARAAGVPVIVVAPSSKLLPAALAAHVSPPEGDPVDLGAPAAVQPVNRPFEAVSWHLVDEVLLDGVPTRPAEVAARVAALAVAPELAARLAGHPAYLAG